MDKKTLIEKVKKLNAARTCCPDLKRAVQKYLISLGKHTEKEAAENLIAEIEKDIMPIDKLVTFARSARAIQIFGKDAAKKFSTHVEKLYASGAKHCDCQACVIAAEILEHKEILLGVETPDKKTLDKQTLLKKLKEIEASPSCYIKLRHMIKRYFNALNTSNEKSVAEDLIEELKADVVRIEQLIIFAHSNSAIEMFGAERAKIFAANADALKARGAKYCNCRACTLGLEVLEHKEVLLG